LGIGIKEIARIVGVSPATVSRALNNEKYVKQDLRQRILKVASSMNYEPNYMAKSLLRNKSNIIGVIVSDIATSFFSTLLKSIERCAAQHDYNIMLCNIDGDLRKEKRGLSLFRQMRVDGIILTHERTDPELSALFHSMTEVPMVACSCKFQDFECASIIIDDAQASFDAVDYLYRSGHRRIAYLGGSLDEFSTGARRYEGVKRAFSVLALRVEDVYVSFSELGVEDGYRMTDEMLHARSGNLPTAIFAGSDELAVGAINCLIDRGFSVPRDLSIVGFDNSAIARYIRPALTTMHQPIEEIGYLSVQKLIGYIDDPSQRAVDVVLPHQLIERDSCRGLAGMSI
jgi:LacI family transcriptional regulator